MRASPDEILTGEGVSLQVQAASLIMRAGAWLIDAVATGVVLTGLIWIAATITAVRDPTFNVDTALANAIVFIVLAVAFLVIPITVETLTHGRSLGKAVFGLLVIRDDGGVVRLRHTTIRALIGFFELWMTMGALAFVVSMLNDKGKRVGDFLAGTYVVQTRGAHSQPLILALPYELAPWLAACDLRPLPSALALQARQFLRRASEFPPPVRRRLGLQLAARLERYVAPAPPTGTHPERFIMAVLYERRSRDARAAAAAAPRLASQLAGIDTLPYSVPDPED